MRCSGEAEEGSGESSGENLHPEMPSQTRPLPHHIFFLFFQEGKLYFLTSSPHEWLCRALLMGSAKLWSPYGAIGRKGGKLERTTRELCMIFFDELIFQKFHKS